MEFTLVSQELYRSLYLDEIKVAQKWRILKSEES